MREAARTTDSLERLAEIVRPHARLAVLLSGGVDSALLAAAAVKALGSGNVLALSAASELVPGEDLESARQVASLLGVRQVVIPLAALSLPEVARNLPERCYACKREIIRLAQEAARTHGNLRLAEGSNADDLADDLASGDRPGLQAVREAGVLSPLAEAGLSKTEVRALARALGLPVWDRPSSPCLATRFPQGHQLTPAEIGFVAAGEIELRALGLGLLRLRWQGGGKVWLEVAPAELELARGLWPTLISRLEPLGLALTGSPLPYPQKRKAPAA